MTDVTLDGIDRLRNAFRELVDAEGLRPLAARTGIPVGQIRSLLDGRAVRVTTLQSMTEVLGVGLTIGPGTDEPGPASTVPENRAPSVRGPSRPSAAAALLESGREPRARPLRDGVAIVRDLADRVAAAAQSLLQVAAGWEPATSPVAAGTTAIAPEGRLVMIPFVSGIQAGGPGREPVFQECPELTVGVAQQALPSWTRPDRLICMRVTDDSMGMTVGEGDFVAVDPGRRDPVDQELFALATEEGPVVRRLRHRNRWLVVADGAVEGQRPLSGGDRILGRVAWRGPRDRDAAGDV